MTTSIITRAHATDVAIATRCARHAHALTVRTAPGYPDQTICQFTYSEGEYAVGPALSGSGSLATCLAGLAAAGREITATHTDVLRSGRTAVLFQLGQPTVADGDHADLADLEQHYGVAYDPQFPIE